MPIEARSSDPRPGLSVPVTGAALALALASLALAWFGQTSIVATSISLQVLRLHYVVNNDRNQPDRSGESPQRRTSETVPGEGSCLVTSLGVRIGLLALPAYGLITAYGTLKPQPDQVSDPEGWARFVSSPSYLLWHVLANVLGTILIILGTLALGAFLRESRAPRLGMSGAVLAVTGYILFMVPGTLSTFATPAIGAAYLAGNREVMAVEFSPVLGPIVGLALLLALIGNVILAVAVWRSGSLPRRAGALWGVATVVFYVLGYALGVATTGASLPTQPVGAVLLAVSGAWIAWTVLRHRPADSSRPPRPRKVGQPANRIFGD